MIRFNGNTIMIKSIRKAVIEKVKIKQYLQSSKSNWRLGQLQKKKENFV